MTSSNNSQIEFDSNAKQFLDRIYAKHTRKLDGSEPRPHVTLTFAQSIDAKIAGKGKKMLPLSCSESMMMTHRLRAMHDGILVGIGTLLNDNPQLNARLLPAPPPVAALPRPIILDSGLRTPLDCKIIKNFQNGTGRKPLIISVKPKVDEKETSARSQKLRELQEVGVEVVEIEGSDAEETSSSLLPWPQILSSIASVGIKRVMIEGGASVISSLLSSTSSTTEPRKLSSLVDTLIITVSPTMVGKEGVPYEAPDFGELDLTQVETRQFGKDAVFVWGKAQR